MISTLLSRIVILTAGTLYPAYRSYKAVRTKDVKEYVKWMMYWIVFGLFCAGEAVSDILLAFWFPFYYELKILFVFWLLSPWTKGASILYRKWVHPMLMKHEEEIDSFLEQAKNESYKQVFSLGTRGLACARDIVATAALRGATFGQSQLADLQRSYSTGDISVAGKGADGRRPLTKVVQKTSFIEEEEEEIEETRTWTGTYDDQAELWSIRCWRRRSRDLTTRKLLSLRTPLPPSRTAVPEPRAVVPVLALSAAASATRPITNPPHFRVALRAQQLAQPTISE